MRLIMFSLLPIGLVVAAADTAHAGVADSLVPHRAVYDLELENASERSGIESMSGRMVGRFNWSSQ